MEAVFNLHRDAIIKVNSIFKSIGKLPQDPIDIAA